MAEQTPDSIITTQRNGQTIVAELFFNHSSTETFRDKLLKLVLADRAECAFHHYLRYRCHIQLPCSDHVFPAFQPTLHQSR